MLAPTPVCLQVVQLAVAVQKGAEGQAAQGAAAAARNGCLQGELLFASSSSETDQGSIERSGSEGELGLKGSQPPPTAAAAGGCGCGEVGEAAQPVPGECLVPLTPPPVTLISARDLEAEVIELLRQAMAAGSAGDEAFLRGMQRVMLTYCALHGGEPWILVEGGAPVPSRGFLQPV